MPKDEREHAWDVGRNRHKLKQATGMDLASHATKDEDDEDDVDGEMDSGVEFMSKRALKRAKEGAKFGGKGKMRQKWK